MYLTRNQTAQGPCWALDGFYLPRHFSLEMLLELPQEAITQLLQTLPTVDPAGDVLLPPLEPRHEIWACGVYDVDQIIKVINAGLSALAQDS